VSHLSMLRMFDQHWGRVRSTEEQVRRFSCFVSNFNQLSFACLSCVCFVALFRDEQLLTRRSCLVLSCLVFSSLLLLPDNNRCWSWRRRSLATSRRSENAVFSRHLYIRTIILPGQARDKHRESSTQKTDCRLLRRRCAFRVSRGWGRPICHRGRSGRSNVS
jgi:hypothetical protein